VVVKTIAWTGLGALVSAMVLGVLYLVMSLTNVASMVMVICAVICFVIASWLVGLFLQGKIGND